MRQKRARRVLGSAVMRRAIAPMAIAICVAITGTQGFAQTNVAALTPPSAEARQSLAPHVVAELLARKVAPNQDPIEAQWVVQLLSYYAAPGAVTVWVDRKGMRPRAAVAIDEMRRADDYALDPSRFQISLLPESQTDPRSLANMEVKLSLLVAKYAFHARGGRIDPTQLSLWLDHKPRPSNAVEVLKSVVAIS